MQYLKNEYGDTGDTFNEVRSVKTTSNKQDNETVPFC